MGAVMDEQMGYTTGIRKHGDMGLKLIEVESMPTCFPDVADCLSTLLRSPDFRRAFVDSLTVDERGALRFVDKAAQLFALSKGREQEKALRLAAHLFKTFVGRRRIDGVGQHDRTEATAAVWARANERVQVKSYAVLDEVMQVAAQRRRLLSLDALPRLVKRDPGVLDLAEEDPETAEDAQVLDAVRFVRALEGSWVEFFKSACSHLGVPVALSDMAAPGAPMIFVNDNFCRMTGYARGECEGRNCRFLQGPSTDPEALGVLRRGLRSAEPSHVLLSNYRKDGQIFRNLLTLRPTFDADGIYRYSIAVQYELDDAGLAPARRLRLLDDLLCSFPVTIPVDSLPAVVAAERDEGDHARAMRLRCTFGWTRIECIINPVSAVRRLASGGATLRILEESACGVGSALADFDLRVWAKQGATDDAYSQAALDRLAFDFLPELVTATEAAHLALAIEPLDGRIEDVFVGYLGQTMSASRLGVTVADMRTAGLPLVYANKKFCAMAGIRLEDAVGHNCRQLQGPATQDYLVEELSRALRTKSSVLVKLFNYRRGKAFQNLVALHPVFDHEGRYTFQVGFQIDMDAPDVEERLVDLEQLLSLMPLTLDLSSQDELDALPHTLPAARPSPRRASRPQTPRRGPRAKAVTPRVALERESIEAISQLTALKWLETRDTVMKTLMKRPSLVRDAFQAFCAKRSRMARLLFKCWGQCELILCADSGLEQRNIARRLLSEYDENPLYLFNSTEVPVGDLSKANMDWQAMFAAVPDLQQKCLRILSRHVFNSFVRDTAGFSILCAQLLGHPPLAAIEAAEAAAERRNDDDSLASHAAMQEDVLVDVEAPSVDPDFYTAAHDASRGVSFLSLQRDASKVNRASLWQHMTQNALNETMKSILNVEREQPPADSRCRAVKLGDDDRHRRSSDNCGSPNNVFAHSEGDEGSGSVDNDRPRTLDGDASHSLESEHLEPVQIFADEAAAFKAARAARAAAQPLAGLPQMMARKATPPRSMSMRAVVSVHAVAPPAKSPTRTVGFAAVGSAKKVVTLLKNPDLTIRAVILEGGDDPRRPNDASDPAVLAAWAAALDDAYGAGTADVAGRLLRDNADYADASKKAWCQLRQGLTLLLQPLCFDGRTKARLVVAVGDNASLPSLAVLSRFLKLAPTGCLEGELAVLPDDGYEAPAPAPDDIAGYMTALTLVDKVAPVVPHYALSPVVRRASSRKSVFSESGALMVSPQRPSTAPINRSARSPRGQFAATLALTEGGGGGSTIDATIMESKPLESVAARHLRGVINSRLDTYLETRRQKHERELDELLSGDHDGQASVSVWSTTNTLRGAVSERNALRRDGLTEKAMELDPIIAKLQAEHKKEQEARFERALTEAQKRLDVTHRNRLRQLANKQKQELMALEREAKAGIDALKEEQRKRQDCFVEEVIQRVTLDGQSDEVEDEARPAAAAAGPMDLVDSPAYLATQQKFTIRASTKPPEMIRQLKIAKHLRRKKRYLEADECERIARDLDLGMAKRLCDNAKKAATGRKLANLVVNQSSALSALERRHESRAQSMQARHDRAAGNLASLCGAEVQKLTKSLRDKFKRADEVPDAAEFLADEDGPVEAGRVEKAPLKKLQHAPPGRSPQPDAAKRRGGGFANAKA